MQLNYEILDVFTDKPFAGNPLGFVELEADIDQDLKQTIAKEFNLSETVFWHKYASSAQKGSKIDIFTPEAEIPFAGHPTIGSSVRILEHFDLANSTIAIKAGILKISKGSDGFVFAQIPHNIHQHAIVPQARSQVLSIVKGMTFILVELDSLSELKEKRSEVPLPLSSLDEAWAVGLTGTYYYVRDPVDPMQIRTRMFTTFDSSGVEDAATGSAACTLAAYLSNISQAAEESFDITQGVEMGRPSKIMVKVVREGSSIKTIELGGQAVRVMKGVITI